MIPQYMQAVLNGNFTEAERIAKLLRPALPDSALAEAFDSVMLSSGLKSTLDPASQLARLRARIEAIAPLADVRGAQGRAGTPLSPLISHMQWAPDLLPLIKFAGFVQAMATPAASLQERAEQISKLIFEPIDEYGPTPSDAQASSASAGVRIGDEAIAHVYKSVDPARDAQWWAELSRETKVQIWVSIILAIVLLLPQIPGYINDYREWREGADAMNKVQGQQLFLAAQASKATLAGLLEVQRQNSIRDADFQRELIALQRQSTLLLDPLVTQACEVRVTTSLRELGPRAKTARRLEAGDLVLCVAHDGKWLQVVFEDRDGALVYGWVRKKHLTWKDAQ